MGRNMGFPNMKYLDPDSHGAPIREETFYKENIKQQRDGYNSGTGQKDMANNTFIKLF